MKIQYYRSKFTTTGAFRYKTTCFWNNKKNKKKFWARGKKYFFWKLYTSRFQLEQGIVSVTIGTLAHNVPHGATTLLADPLRP